jgi:hypothetical protein
MIVVRCAGSAIDVNSAVSRIQLRVRRFLYPQPDLTSMQIPTSNTEKASKWLIRTGKLGSESPAPPFRASSPSARSRTASSAGFKKSRNHLIGQLPVLCRQSAFHRLLRSGRHIGHLHLSLRPLRDEGPTDWGGPVIASRRLL